MMLPKLIRDNMVLSDQAIYSLISFSLTIVLSRFMSLENFGLFSSLIIVLYLLSGISQSLLIQPMQSKVMELLTNTGYAKMLLFLQAGFSFGICIIGFLVTSFFEISSQLSANVIMLFCMYASVFMLYDFLRKYFLATDQPKACFKMDVIYAFSTLAFVGSMIFTEVIKLDLVFLLLLLALVPALIYGLIKFTNINKEATDWSKLREQWNLGKWYLFAAISQWFSSNFFVMSSGVFLSIEALGALRLVQTVFGVFNIFLQSVENYIIPQVNLILESSFSEAVSFLNKLLKKTLFWMLPILILLFIFSKETIVLFGGEQYLEFHLIVKGFSLLYLSIFLFYPVRIIIRAKGFKKSFFLGYLISGLAGVLSCQFFFDQFSIHGAAAGLFMGQIILFLTWIAFLSNQKIKLWKLYI